MTVELHLFTRRFLGTTEAASQFLSTLEQANLLPGKIGSHEPVREPFQAGKALDIWCRAKRGSTQVAGGMMCKRESPRYTCSVSWARGPNARPGYLYFLLTHKDFRSNSVQFVDVFRKLFVDFDGLFGYVSEEKAANRQHVTGSLETRLPGLFWCTAFGNPYVEWFGGRERVLSGPWHSAESLAGSVMVYLAESPLDKRLTATPTLEQVGKQYLGADSFGDPEAFRANIFVPQVKNVPSLDLPEIRVPLT